jgi:light-regulated signal transduction histidine kinase (bacteriophytochrome)
VTDGAGHPQYAIADVVDITARKQAEEALWRSNAQLKRANDSLQQFAYSASHDLQEPLRMMTCYSDLLMQKVKDELDSDAATFLQFIREGAHRMQMFLKDMLQYTRLELADEIAPRSVDCSAALKTALINLTSVIEESGAVVTYEPLPIVLGEYVHFVQLFQNLVGNAIKYRGEEAPRVHVAADQREEMWCFSVRDNGIGIEPQNATTIFKLFNRLKRDTPGTGIGLAICAKVVERHGGQIWVESELGRGSTFFFTVPVAGQVHLSTCTSTSGSN